MEPWSRSGLGAVGEGLWVVDSAHPLTQLSLGSFRNPLPRGEGRDKAGSHCLSQGEREFVIQPNTKRLTPIARRLRRDKTDAEDRLWRHLRNRQLEGAKFRFQAPVDRFVADFLCSDVRLIVELDGGQHGEQAEKDAARTRALEAAGYTVMRFWNNDVLSNTNGVLEEIRLALLNARATT